jgi:hypothetical protein
VFWFGLIRRWPLIWALGALLQVAPAIAQHRHRVVVVEPEGEDAAAEVRARLRGELRAGGFDVIALPAPDTGDPREISETSARELHPAAVLFVTISPDVVPSAGEIWLSDRLLRRTFVLKFSLNATEPSRDAARVAVQAVEVLKADLAELSLTRREPPAPPPTPSTPPAPPAAPPPSEIEVAPPEPESSGFEPRVEAGAGILQGFSGVGTAVTPVVRLGGRLPASWFGEQAPAVDVLANFAAFGGERRLRQRAGEARVKQTLGTLSVAARFLPQQVVQPFVSLSSGIYGVRVDGLAASGVSRAADTWSAVSGGGAGLLLQPTEGIAFVLSGELLAAWSRTIVNIAEQRVASVGAPVLLLTAGVAGVF